MTHCELSRVVSVFVTLRNKLSDDQKEIWHLQSRDRLTGLYNLETFRKKVEELFAWEKKEPSGSTYALVHVDINNFSYVNENFGQIVGDNILKEFGTAVGKLSQVPYASRMYSDYFILLVWGESREEVCKNIETGKVYFEHQQKKKYPAAGMRFSVGAYFLDDFEESFEVMLENANLARKHAKELLSTKICIYQEQLRAKRDDEIQVTGRFYGALQRGEFELFLQPKFLLNEKRIYGAEALARWRMPDGELISPTKFIPPLENIGYIVDLDFYILEQLLRVMRRWKRAGKELESILKMAGTTLLSGWKTQCSVMGSNRNTLRLKSRKVLSQRICRNSNNVWKNWKNWDTGSRSMILEPDIPLLACCLRFQRMSSKLTRALPTGSASKNNVNSCRIWEISFILQKKKSSSKGSRPKNR